MRVVKWGIGCVVVLIALVAVCGSEPKKVPDVVGMYPQEAIDAIHDAGIDDTESHGGIGSQEGTGFAVCRTEPAAGEATDDRVDIFSARDCPALSPTAKKDRVKWTRAKRAERREKAQAARRRERLRKERREERKELQRLLEQDGAEPEPEPQVDETDGAPEGTCDEVGITDFAVPPGDERDADGDGIACETSSSGTGVGAELALASHSVTATSKRRRCVRPDRVQPIGFSRTKYPNIRRHFQRAIAAGWPRVQIVNRPRSDDRRERLLRDFPTRDGLDRDEYPAAVLRGRGRGLERGRNPRGWKARVRYVPSSENRSHGATLGIKMRRLCNGTRVRYVFY